MDQPSKGVPTVKVEVTAAQVEAAVSAAANAASLPTAEVIGKQPMTQFHQGFYWCNACSSGMNCETALDMHLAGRKHKSKLARLDANMFTPHVPLGPLPGSNPNSAHKKKSGGTGRPVPLPNAKFKCEVCDCEFPSEIPYQSHMAGKKHLRKVNAPQINSENSRFSCALCQFIGNSPAHLEAHLQGKAHAKKAGLPPPPPGPPSTPAKPFSEKKPKQKPYRYNPYFKPRDRHSSSSSSGYYQTTRVPQVKSESNVAPMAIPTVHGAQSANPAAYTTSAQSANPAAYTTGIVGNYGFQLYDK